MIGRRDFESGFHRSMKPNTLRHFLDGQRNDLYPTLIQQLGFLRRMFPVQAASDIARIIGLFPTVRG